MPFKVQLPDYSKGDHMPDWYEKMPEWRKFLYCWGFIIREAGIPGIWRFPINYIKLKLKIRKLIKNEKQKHKKPN